MRIAQVSPLYESVPPKLYGGTERVVHYLTEELVRQGHDVTLFASGDSETSARLVSSCPAALRLNPGNIDGLAAHFLMLEKVFDSADDFDVIHLHVDYLHFPFSRGCRTPHVTTLHGRLDVPRVDLLYRQYSEMPIVSISDSQRRPMEWANWQGTVHHGLPTHLLRPGSGEGGYLAFLGRISPEKRVDRAIEIARRVGLPIRIAAKVDVADRAYFEKSIRPLLQDPQVDYVGELGDRDKGIFLGNARAFLFPIDWPEPFGLVMIESMACGTPVVAFRGGSVEEVLEDGVTGFIVDSIDEAVKAVLNIDQIDRERCRKVFDSRFSAQRMVADYVKIYSELQASTDALLEASA